ncbi:2-succinyl-5-enolpyruvyl-6-hydroxy-3-cyclohexene-1-carboxylic-acid synthase [Lentzea flaviverrucosa]|uniref:2-succinyl-5-enolpyruvyl-6-hydroxy-3-cyclohexene-1-carboxylate synthase n=1 Tax=Lentzea flaviverrucosa TaxID=200379 RepID=A0A1H9P0E2_9PSEU|nr:2-succinyl-5-enolpyruvyl-6-hydroxy-3-cyclohexene-1-carboxylic-acid synthase [Lentzea flaviverrucosa]RDI30017.1 2-succinyl-5-enolpyruvyl-6-hydroxy-3-cyclohexene-1-carboxylate synthase [Lentzea flaviverrucosa]SER41660.1 2-succinyl-5-enolpyruvyl-6-hydroxy-3-cyclohexene-1-carboxylate synthase [Lentzea flaviverrucosa]
MNPSTTQARVIVDELVRNGVRHVVLCPGSRNAPLSFALHQAEQKGLLTVHVRIDERSGGFLALGLAKTGEPAVVTCTSGTAVANLHPAVIEAQLTNVPLIALTADRPVELYRTGSSQTINQHDVLGIPTLHMPEGAGEAVTRSLICRAVATDGPSHVNVPFRPPLTPSDDQWPSSDRGAWTETDRTFTVETRPSTLPARTLVLLGDDRPERLLKASRLGWPVIAEPTAPGGLRHGSLLLNAGLPEHLRPDAVLVVGRVTLSRGQQTLLGAAPIVHAVGDQAQWPDVPFTATRASTWLPEPAALDGEWLQAWQSAVKSVSVAVDDLLDAAPWPTGLHVARDLVQAMPSGSLLFVGSSNPIRDVDFASERRSDVVVHANRGAAGIDGSVSTAIGLAWQHEGPAYALMGDLTFLHDSNGLLADRLPDLTIVVLNDDGGGIFSLLEQGAPEYGGSFERIFGTPHGTDLTALCAGYRIPHSTVDGQEEFRSAIASPKGLQVVEVQAKRDELRALHQRLKATVSNVFTR